MPDNLIGKMLGRYHLLEKLGEGGMAVVYKALDTSLERHVAVKVILPYQEQSEQFLARFKREARALARLSHPNILKIFDFGEYEGSPYLVMEYIAGGTLKEWLVGKAVPWQRSAQLLGCVARALEAAHAEGIIHRDVKPANILMANGKDPMLSDFGIAKLIEGSEVTTDLTGTGVGIGTPDYMAPEQGVGIADERSDIYALGVIFYQMVTGRLPYEADTPLAVLLKKTTEPLPRPTHYVPDLPVSVENVLIKALTREPQYRYQNMGEFAAALERLGSKADTLETLSTEMVATLATSDVAGQSSEPDSAKRSRGRLPLAVSVGILITCCGALLVGALLWRTVFAGASPIPGIFRSTATPSPTEATPTPGPTNQPPPTRTASPVPMPTVNGGGKWIAFNSRMDGDADIYLVDTEGNKQTQMTTSSAHDLYPSWSPDGKKIVYQNNDGGDWEIAFLDMASKKVTRVTNNDCDDWGPVWSPDGDWFTFYSDCDGDRNVYKTRTNGKDRKQLTFTSGSNSWFPTWSPDGRQITFSSNRSGKYHIYVMNADGSNVRDLAAGCVSYFSPDGKQILYGVYCDDTDDIFVMDADGSNQTAVTDGYECKNATWSPDGIQIVFQLSQTTKDGPFEIYRMSLDRPDRSDWTLLTVYEVNGGSPVWQP
jgi:serine/threonine protein kinase/Tol biopolymer transport system component